MVSVGEVTIVAVGARRHSRSHARIQFGRIESPLFARIIAKEFLVQLPAYFTNDDVFRRADAIDWLCNFLKKFFDFKRGQTQTVKSIDGVEIDWNRDNLSVDTRANAMLIRAPIGKPREIFKDFP